MNFKAFSAMILQVLPSVFEAISIVQADAGKPWEEAVSDVINHLTPGAPDAPALSQGKPQ